MKRTSLIQILVLMQAATIITLGFSLVGPFTSSFSQYSNPVYILRGNGNAISAAVIFSALPQAMLRTLISVAIFWWISEQKRIVGSGSGDIPIRRRSKIVAVVAIIMLCVSFGIFALQRKPSTITFSESDIQQSK